MPCVFLFLWIPGCPLRPVFSLLSAQSLSHVWLFATPWTVACQAPPSLGFSRQEYQSALSCPPPGDLPNPGIKPRSLAPLALAGDSLPLVPPGKPQLSLRPSQIMAVFLPTTPWAIGPIVVILFITTSRPSFFLPPWSHTMSSILLFDTLFLIMTYHLSNLLPSLVEGLGPDLLEVPLSLLYYLLCFYVYRHLGIICLTVCLCL